MPLTETSLRALKAGDKTRRITDSRGLYIEISTSGSKLWRFKYRFGEAPKGKTKPEKRLSFGMYPEVGLALARERREEARAMLARGVDPGAVKKAQKAAGQDAAANSFEVVTREFYAKQKDGWSETYSTRWLGRMVYDLFPLIGSRPIVDITAPELLDILRKVETRGVPYTANRLLKQCGQVFRYAIATRRGGRDHSADLRGALQVAHVTHFAATTEPEDFKQLLKDIYAYKGTAVVRAALRLSPLVFVRPGELRQAKKADIDLDKAEWRFIGSKTKKRETPALRVVPLSTQAVAILRELEPYTEGSEFVFPGQRSLSVPMSDNAVLVAMRRLEISDEVMTPHGFRAVIRTIGDEVLGFRPELIEHQLGHAVRDANGRAYNRTSFLPERRKMMQDWADYCDELRTGVIPFAKRA